MNPFFFGTADEQLFGVYYPPTGPEERSIGVVLCPPFGQEYMRSHRAFRQLGFLLSKTGSHVLRFDYRGSGDSSGDGESVTLESGVADIRTAVDELLASTDLDRIALVGLRLGAAQAVLAAEDCDAVKDLVLWDPVINGERYVDEMLNLAPRISTQNGDLGNLRDLDVVGVNGFPLTHLAMDQLSSLDLMQVEYRNFDSVSVVCSHEREEFQNLRARLAQQGHEAFELIPSNGDWNQVKTFGGVLLHTSIVQQIVTWIEGVQ